MPEDLLYYLRPVTVTNDMYFDFSSNRIPTLPRKLFYGLKPYTITLYAHTHIGAACTHSHRRSMHTHTEMDGVSCMSSRAG